MKHRNGWMDPRNVITSPNEEPYILQNYEHFSSEIWCSIRGKPTKNSAESQNENWSPKRPKNFPNWPTFKNSIFFYLFNNSQGKFNVRFGKNTQEIPQSHKIKVRVLKGLKISQIELQIKNSLYFKFLNISWVTFYARFGNGTPKILRSRKMS